MTLWSSWILWWTGEGSLLVACRASRLVIVASYYGLIEVLLNIVVVVCQVAQCSFERHGTFQKTGTGLFGLLEFPGS